MSLGVELEVPARRFKKKPAWLFGSPLGGELLTSVEAAAYLSISPDTLRGWRKRKQRCGPCYIKVHAHAVRYRLCDLETFLEGRLVKPASGMPGEKK